MVLRRRATHNPGRSWWRQRSDPAHAASCRLLAGSVRRWAPDASALVFTLHRTASGPEADALAYSDYALYDLGQAVAHLTIQAASLELATHQFAAFDHAGLAAAADVPPHWQVTTGIAIGRAIESDVRQRDRRPLEEFAYGATFGEPRSGYTGRVGERCDGRGYQKTFGDGFARRVSRRYRKRGLDKTQRRLVDFVAERGIEGATVLEIGGGIGELQVELLRRGADRATNLEISEHYEAEAAACSARPSSRAGSLAASTTSSRPPTTWSRPTSSCSIASSAATRTTSGSWVPPPATPVGCWCSRFRRATCSTGPVSAWTTCCTGCRQRLPRLRPPTRSDARGGPSSRHDPAVPPPQPRLERRRLRPLTVVRRRRWSVVSVVEQRAPASAALETSCSVRGRWARGRWVTCP